MPTYFDFFLLYSAENASAAPEITCKLEDSGLKIWPPSHLTLADIDNGLKITALENSKGGLVLVGKNGLDLETYEFKLMLERARTDETNHDFAGDRAFRLVLGFLPSFPLEEIPKLKLPPESQLELIKEEEIVKVVNHAFRLAFLTPPLNKADNISNEFALPVIKPARAKNRGREKLLAGVCLLLIISLVFNFIQWQKPTNTMANTTTQPQEVDKSKELALSKSRELVANAAANLNNNPDLSLLLATEAFKKADTPETESALRQAVSQPIPRLVKLANPQPASFNSGKSYTLSPDLKRLVTVTTSGNIPGKSIVELWSTENGTKLSQFPPVGGTFYDTQISPDGKLLFMRNSQGSIQMWDLDSERMLFEMKGQILGATFSPDGKYLAYFDARMVQMVKTSTGEVVTSIKSPTINTSMYFSKVAFTPDSQNVLTSFANTPQLWQVTTGKLIMEYKGHSDSILANAFSSDGQFLATSSQDHTVRIWRVDSGKEVRDSVTTLGLVTNISFSPDSNYLAINDDNNFQIQALNGTGPYGGMYIGTLQNGTGLYLGRYTGTLQNWSADSKSFIVQNQANGFEVYQVDRYWPSFTFYHPTMVMASGYTSNGTEMLTVGGDGIIRYWSLANRTPVGEIQGDKAILDTTYSPDGKSVAIGSVDNKAVVWQPSNRYELKGHTKSVNKVLFNPNSSLIATGSADGTVKIWKSGSGELITTLKVTDKEVTVLAFSPYGQILAVGAEDGNIRLWQTSNWQEAGILGGHKASVTNLSFSLDSKKLVSGSKDETAIIWAVGSGQLLQTLDGHKGYVYSTAFSPDGKLVVTGSSDYSARVWEVESGRLLFNLEGHRGVVLEVKFTQDGKRIITADEGNQGSIWDSSNGNFINQIGIGVGYREPSALGLFGKISSDNRFIVVSESDTAQVWDIATDRKVAEYIVPAGHIQFITISPDSKNIILGLSSGKSLVYQCQECGTAPDLLQLAESKATRLLTEEEKTQYLH